MRLAAKPSVGAPFDAKLRSFAIQAFILLAVIGFLAFLANTAMTSLARQGIASGFAFLGRPVPFDLSESIIPFSPGVSYARAFLAGLANTLAVAVLGILVAAVLGFFVGLARLSENYLLSRLASAYVEWMRNVPLILHLSIWYVLLTVNLPQLRNAYQPIEGFYLSNRGVQVPRLIFEPQHVWIGVAFLAAIVGAFLWRSHTRKVRETTGRRLPLAWPTLVMLFAVPLVAFVMTGAPIGVEMPELRGFNFRGGSTLSPEFAALVIGLSTYTSAFIGEIVRAGIQAVPSGQSEAGSALGLHKSSIMWLIVMPQAMRIIVPPATTQFTNLMKNSSLAVVIGYPDLVSVANTSLNQTGQAIECIAIMMGAYLVMSSLITLIMALFDRKPTARR